MSQHHHVVPRGRERWQGVHHPAQESGQGRIRKSGLSRKSQEMREEGLAQPPSNCSSEFAHGRAVAHQTTHGGRTAACLGHGQSRTDSAAKGHQKAFEQAARMLVQRRGVLHGTANRRPRQSAAGAATQAADVLFGLEHQGGRAPGRSLPQVLGVEKLRNGEDFLIVGKNSRTSSSSSMSCRRRVTASSRGTQSSSWPSAPTRESPRPAQRWESAHGGHAPMAVPSARADQRPCGLRA